MPRKEGLSMGEDRKEQALILNILQDIRQELRDLRAQGGKMQVHFDSKIEHCESDMLNHLQTKYYDMHQIDALKSAIVNECELNRRSAITEAINANNKRILAKFIWVGAGLTMAIGALLFLYDYGSIITLILEAKK